MLAAQSLTGRVTDPGGVPLAGITVDAGSGIPVTTGALGTFTIAGLANNSYDVEYLPAQGAPWAAREIETTVSGITNVGDIVLEPGADIIGVALTEGGLPIASCNLNVYAQDGTKLFTPYDNTNALGQFAVTVPLGTWDLRVQPPVGSTMVSTTLEDIAVAGPTPIGNVTLRTGYLVTGSVGDAVTTVPIGNTRFKVWDAITGERFVIPNDTTNVFGQFSFLLPYGIADFEVIPPAGNTHVGKQMFGVIVVGPTAMGSIGLQSGVTVSGNVTANGGSLAGADIDVLNADGTKVFTAFDNTDAGGNFSVVVPTGSGMIVRVEPVASTGLVGATTAPLNIAANTNVGTINLASGVAVSGNVMGQGAPEFDAALNFVDTATGVELITITDHTDVAGNYTTYVPPGNYDVTVVTADGSLSKDATQNVTITGAATVDFTLSLKLARTQVTSYGIPTLGPGALMPINVLLHTTTPGWTPILIDLYIDMPTSPSIPLLYGVPLTLPHVPFVVGPVFLPVPPLPASEVGKPLEMRVVLRDATGLIIYDEADATFYVQ